LAIPKTFDRLAYDLYRFYFLDKKFTHSDEELAYAEVDAVANVAAMHNVQSDLIGDVDSGLSGASASDFHGQDEL